MTPLEALKAARVLITDQTHWRQGGMAGTADGADCPPLSDAAFCFCATGAVIRVTEARVFSPGVFPATRALAILDLLAGIETEPGDPRPIAWFNDNHDHAAVLALFDQAIAESEGAA